jgi:hypothetical protein
LSRWENAAAGGAADDVLKLAELERGLLAVESAVDALDEGTTPQAEVA